MAYGTALRLQRAASNPSLPVQRGTLLRLDRAFQSFFRRVTVSLTYVEEATPSPVPDASVGIDMGLSERLALSDGSMYPGRALDRDGLAEKQRRLSRCQ